MAVPYVTGAAFLYVQSFDLSSPIYFLGTCEQYPVAHIEGRWYPLRNL